MSPTRRALLGSLATGSAALSGSLAGIDDRSTTTDDGSATDPRTTTDSSATTTAASLVVEPVDLEAVAGTDTIGVVDDIVTAVANVAAGEEPAIGLGRLTALNCFAFEGTSYRATTQQGSGGYANHYRVEKVEDSGDAEVVAAQNLSTSNRATIRLSIERGEYTYDSRNEGFQPDRGVLYRYNGSLYRFEQTLHADHGTVTRYQLETVDWSCPTIEALSTWASNHFSSVAQRDDAAFPVAVPERHREELRQFDYLLTEERVLAVRTRR